jgi:RNA polymerase sigma factor (sigma-70 family)
VFPSTRQSLVGRPAEGEFFELYRMPCLRYVKWRYPGMEAEDLVQGFFTAVLEQGIVEKFDREKGRFRPYLRACLDQYVLKERNHSGRLKRGGHLERVDLDEGAIGGGENPEERFEREWERGVFEWAIAELHKCHADSVRWQVFEAHDLAENDRPSYAELAEMHGVTVVAVTNHLAWARREVGRLVRQRL